MEDRIVLITPQLYQRIYSNVPVVSNYSAEYLHTVPIIDNLNVYEMTKSGGFYARINEQLSPSCYGFSTFGVMIGDVGTPQVRIGVINLEGVTLASVTDRQILAALGVTPVEETPAPVVESVPIPVTPAKPVEEKPKKTLREELIECVTNVYGENYDWSQPRKLIIHWPEFEITNSKKHKHTIRDLFVKLSFSWYHDGAKCKLDQVPNGKRLTLTRAEINAGYRHSHMSPGITSDWGHFCVGSGPVPDMIAQLLEDVTPENFFLFLVLLDQYVRWESLEGGPYIRIASISTTGTSGSSMTPITTAREIKVTTENILHNFRHKLHDFIRCTSCLYGGYTFTVRYQSEAFDRFINETWTGEKYQYDPISAIYVSRDNRSFTERYFGTGSFIFKGQGWRYKIYNPNENTPERQYILIPPPDAPLRIAAYLQELLNVNWPPFVKEYYMNKYNLTHTGQTKVQQLEEIPF